MSKALVRFGEPISLPVCERGDGQRFRDCRPTASKNARPAPGSHRNAEPNGRPVHDCHWSAEPSGWPVHDCHWSAVQTERPVHGCRWSAVQTERPVHDCRWSAVQTERPVHGCRRNSEPNGLPATCWAWSASVRFARRATSATGGPKQTE